MNAKQIFHGFSLFLILSFLLVPGSTAQADRSEQVRRPDCEPFELLVKRDPQALDSIPAQCALNYRDVPIARDKEPSDPGVGAFDYGGPDFFGYRYDDSAVPFSWISASTKSTLAGDNAFIGPLNIGFTFPFYGIPQTQLYVNTNGLITSSGGVPIIASERVAYFDGSNWTSFSEVMGLPSNQLTTSYVMPYYNNVELNTQLRFGNVGTANTIVTVKVGGVTQGTYFLAPNQSKRVSYPGLNNGLVKITSSGGVPIIASERVAYFDGSNWTSFSEMMGLPANQLYSSYVLPWYNNVELNTQLRFGVP